MILIFDTHFSDEQESEIAKYKQDAAKEARLECQVKQVEKENAMLRKHIFSLQGEVYGARLAAKYLDKELAGRYTMVFKQTV